VRKGTYDYALKTRAYCGSEPLETPFIAENTFNRGAPRVEVAGPYGAGIVVGSRVNCHDGLGSRAGAPDRNARVPGSSNSLEGGVNQVERSGRYRP